MTDKPMYTSIRRYTVRPDSVDEVITNWVPIDRRTHLGPGVQSSEVWRILKHGGKWVRNGRVYQTKP